VSSLYCQLAADGAHQMAWCGIQKLWTITANDDVTRRLPQLSMKTTCPPRGVGGGRYELTGGFVKNSWLTALSLAVSRDGIHPTVTQVLDHSAS
jgi:hypothetical protein